MTLDPAQGGRQPQVKPLFSIDLLKLLPALARWLGFTGPKKDSQKAKGG